MAGQQSELGKREREILRAIVQDYIGSGEPVASGPLLARHGLECSPATVRAVMSDLEALGYLEKPHASAGRIPTERGYRVYVDTLLRVRPPSPEDRGRIESISQVPEVPAMLEAAATLLHSLSHHAAVVTTPRPTTDPLRHVEFVRLRDDRCLAVFVSEAGIVTNKLLQLEFAMTASELERAAGYLNEKLGRLPLAALRDAILAEMRADKGAVDELVEKALTLAEQTFAAHAGLVAEGEESFLDAPEFADVQKARALLRAFAEKDRVLRVLDRAMSASEVQIFIGAESEFASIPDVSVIAAPYRRGDAILGSLAVIGPTRMNYGKVIPLVDLTAREVSRALAGEAGPVL